MNQLLDQQYRMLFLRNRPGITNTDERTGEPAVDGIPFEVGQFWASEIATIICEHYGLKCQWSAPDYILQTDFQGVGRPIDLLNALVEPFQSLPAFQADIFCVGTTVYVRARTGTFTADPNCTMSAHDARISRLTIRKKRGPTYGKITLLGIYGMWKEGGFLRNPVAFDYTVTMPMPYRRAEAVTRQVIRSTTYRSP